MGKTGALFFVFVGLILALALFQGSAFAVCQTCEAGSYESAESGYTYCNCWSGSYEECEDPFTKSTVYVAGVNACWLSCSANSGTDYCQDSNTLKEAYLDCYCCDEVKWTTINCNDYDGSWSYYGSGNCVMRQRKDYSCSSGRCTYSWAYETVSCNGDASYCYDKKNYLGTGCSHGQYDCDWDSECSSGLICKGPILGSMDGCCYSSEYWNGNTHQCVNCVYDSHCPSDYCTNWEYTCTDTQVKKTRTCYDYYCTGSGTCSYSTNIETDWISNNGDSDYCDKRETYCTAKCTHGQYDCDSNSECESGLVCKGGIFSIGDGCCYSYELWDDNKNQCVECVYDSHCPSDYYEDWVYYCSANDLRKHRKLHDSYCSGGSCASNVYWTDDQLVETCYYGCSGSSCNPPPLITFQGTVKYYDQREGKYKVLPGVKVELWDEDALDDNKIDTGETDNQGRFIFTNIDTDSWDAGVGDAADIYVNIVMESPIVAVSEAWNPTIINYKSSTYPDVLVDKDIAVNIGSSSSPVYHPESAAANVMDVIKAAYLLYKSYDPSWSRNQIFVELHDEGSWICTLLRAIGIDDCSGAHFEQSFKDEIHLYGENIWRDSTIAHEYSHAVMYEAYGNDWPSMPIPYSDYIKDYNFIGLTGVGQTVNGHLAFMESGPGFAMTEGWAEFMEAVDYGSTVFNPLYDSGIDLTAWCAFGFDFDNNSAIEKYDTFHEGSDLEDNKWWMGEDALCYSCNDSNCGGTEQWRQDSISNPNRNTGDIVEGTVASILWDIYDSNNTDELNGEGISDGFYKLWSIIRKDNPDNILGFWDHWFSTSDNTPTNYGDFNRLAYIYEMYGIDKCPDSDGDGYDSNECGGRDCNDGNASVNPGAAELCDYTIDNDCDGVIDEGCVIECSSNPGCGTNGWVGSTYCSSNNVYQDYRTYTCHYPGTYDSYCSYSDPPQMKQDCGTGSCGSWGSNYCSSDDLWHSRTCHDRGCSSGACFDSTYTEKEKVQECGSDSCDAWGPNYCKDGHVYHSRTCYDRGCSTSSCFETQNIDEQRLYDCGATGCDNGKCLSIRGDVNGDCKVNVFDLAAVGLCYGQSATGNCEDADLNGDSSVNIFDLAAVGINYGNHC